MSTSEELDRRFLPGFERSLVDTGDGELLALVGGAGPAVLLLHGDPQTHLCWAAVAPVLARERTVVLADLRGRGESHKPRVSHGHQAYAKRVMAAEMLALMRRLGYDRFDVVGHDRGARVGRRLALDHPEVVRTLTIMDLVPEIDLYVGTTATLAHDYCYFFFLPQPHPIPERLGRVSLVVADGSGMVGVCGWSGS